MRTFRRFLSARYLIDWKSLRVKIADCPLCGPSVLVRLARQEIAVRCLRCGASAITMSIISLLKAIVPDLDDKEVYEMSSRGPLVGFLKARCRQVTCSEYFDDVPPGAFRGGVQCQDVERLTFPDGCFDLCTSTEVFEHVADDARGFAEVRRVLKPRGLFIFTVPLSPAEKTIERAVIEHGQRDEGPGARGEGQALDPSVHPSSLIPHPSSLAPRPPSLVHLLPPEYHGDWIRGVRRVLAFRNYGGDIVVRLLAAGFRAARIEPVDGSAWWNCGRPVVVAER